MTIRGSKNNSYDGGSENGVWANSVAFTDEVFVKKTAWIVTKSAATEQIDWVNSTIATMASDNQTVDQKKINYAPAILEREYEIELAGQVITFSGVLVTSNVVDLNVNGVAMTSVPFNGTDSQTLADIATQLVTDFPTLIESATAGTNLVEVVGVDNNASVSITDVVVTLGAGQATAVVTAETIAQTDEEAYFDIANESIIDPFTKSASTGQVQLVRYIGPSVGSFRIVNA